MNEAALFAARRDHAAVEQRDFTDAIEKIILGAERQIVMTDADRKRTAYHESGHALVGMLTPGADPVRKVSIIPRGQALGVTLSTPETDRYGYSRDELVARIKVSLGGRVAEQVVYGDTTTGAESDIQNLTRIARGMVARWGMSDELGPLAIADGPQDGLLLPGSTPASPATLERVDEETRRIVEEAEGEVAACSSANAAGSTRSRTLSWSRRHSIRPTRTASPASRSLCSSPSHTRSSMGCRRRFVGALLALAAAVAAFGVTPGPAAEGHVGVYFLQGEQLAPVTRVGSTPLDAVRQLIAGPTQAERRHGFRTYVPAGTLVRSVTVANGIATVDLNERFASGGEPRSLLARLSQLVRTLTGLQGARRVQLLMNGGPVAARFPGHLDEPADQLRFLQTPNVAVPEPPQLRLPPPDAGVKTVQQRLIELGYLLPSDDDGRFGPATQNAILAFQKWERLARTGLLDGPTKARLATASTRAAHSGRPRQARRDLARPPGRASDQRTTRSCARSPFRPGSRQLRLHQATIASTRRSRAGGRRRFANGFPGRCRSSVASPSTSCKTSRPTLRRMDVSANLHVARWTYDFANGRDAGQGDCQELNPLASRRRPSGRRRLEKPRCATAPTRPRARETSPSPDGRGAPR